MPENPLVVAIKRDHELFPRTLEVGLPEIAPVTTPGSEVTFQVTGNVKSVNDEGKAFIEISSISPGSSIDAKPPIFRTEVSPSPS